MRETAPGMNLPRRLLNGRATWCRSKRSPLPICLVPPSARLIRCCRWSGCTISDSPCRPGRMGCSDFYALCRLDHLRLPGFSSPPFRLLLKFSLPLPLAPAMQCPEMRCISRHVSCASAAISLYCDPAELFTCACELTSSEHRIEWWLITAQLCFMRS